MECIHDQSVIFMDVKLENLLVSAEGHVQLADFGLARYSDSEMRPALIGTPSYFSPEMIRGTTNHNRTMMCGRVVSLPTNSFAASTRLMILAVQRTFLIPSWKTPYTFRQRCGLTLMPSTSSRIQNLLVKEPPARLGGSGWEDVKAHPFFAPLNWNHVYNLTYDPLLKPQDLRQHILR